MITAMVGAKPIRTLAVVLLTALVVAACGTSRAGSGAAQALLRATFNGPHSVRSGVLDLRLSATPSGSRTITTPITLGLGGPFQSRGHGNLPASSLNFTINGLGHHGQLGIISTGANGYVTLGGAAYQLPAADYQKLASSFSGAAGGAGTGGLSNLGIDPLHWLTDPQIVGNETVGGAVTTHIRARVQVASLLRDLNSFLGKASATGATGGAALPTTISAATRRQIAAAVRNATVDVWTGSSDKTLRKLSVDLDVPVTGQISTLLGGLSSAAINLTLQYANLNQPQSITAPAHVQPFSGFSRKIKGIVGALQTTFGSGTSGTAATGGGSASGSASAGSAATVNKYSRCLQRSGGDIAKMQTCASLLGGG
jgi:hypothetical protein